MTKHARVRGKERFSLDLSTTDQVGIINRIFGRNGWPHPSPTNGVKKLGQRSNRVKIFAVCCAGKWIPFVVDMKREVIITVLPQDALARYMMVE